MKIIAINGSPRKNKNTATLLQKALEGASIKGAQTELINLYDYKFTGCINCFACKIKGKYTNKCVIKDDLHPIIEKLHTVNAIVLGSPIYFMNMTAGMMAFLERFIFPGTIYSEEIPTIFPKTIPTGFIYTMNIKEERKDFLGIGFNKYEFFLEKILGKEPKTLYSFDTVQFDNYSKYESSIFSETEKIEHRAKQFPIDSNNAYKMGIELVEAAIKIK